jgi:NDP-sugar pyrophosphorylase family protein
MDADSFCYFSRNRAQVDSMDLGARKLQHSPTSGLLGVSNLRGVRALVLVGAKPETERFGETPIALLDVLGRSTLLRTIDRLRAAGVREIVVLSDVEPLPPRPASDLCKFSVPAQDCVWGEALRQVRRFAQQSECVMVLRLGPWAEVDYAAMVGQHRRVGSALTQAYSAVAGLLEMFVISSSSMSEAAALMRGEMRDERIQPALYETSGYVNTMSTPADIRKLVLDSFAGAAAVPPYGQELRPGVWVGRKARIHREARLLAPAFIGAFCNVHRDAVVTRGSSMEHHSELERGTVVDGSSLLPYTRVAAGLDVTQSVVGFGQVHSLEHQVTVDVEDTQLIGNTHHYYPLRAVSTFNWLIALLPNVLWKYVFQPRPEHARAASEVLRSTAPILGDTNMASGSETKSYREMVVTRRYGDE